MTEVQRESRATVAQESPFNPMSLCGSWAIYDGQVGLVVGEPQAGVYLIEWYNIADAATGQTIVNMERLENEPWTFFDTHAAAVAAVTELMNS